MNTDLRIIYGLAMRFMNGCDLAFESLVAIFLFDLGHPYLCFSRWAPDFYPGFARSVNDVVIDFRLKVIRYWLMPRYNKFALIERSRRDAQIFYCKFQFFVHVLYSLFLTLRTRVHS